MNKIEISAKNVEEALTQAMIRLGTTSDKMEYEVISEGRSGFFGIGSRPAVIKAWIREDAISEELESFMKTPVAHSETEKTAEEEKPAAAEEPAVKPAVKAESRSNLKVASTPEEFISQVCNAM